LAIGVLENVLEPEGKKQKEEQGVQEIENEHISL
jgi:hypothetical protein